jgi:iron(III) transport system substrate-binding protein
MLRVLRRSAIVLSTVAAALTLSACAATDPESDAADDPTEAVAADALVVYSGRSEELAQPAIEQFEAATGIDVEVRYADSAQLAAQLVEEGERSPADVFFSQDAGAMGAVSEAGLAAPLPDELLDRVPSQFRAADGTWAGVTGRARVVVYDPEAVPADQVPTSVFDLTDPAWEGQVGVAPANASFQSFVTAMRVLEGEQATQQWLDDLVANDVQVFEDNTAILEAVDNGVVSAGLINHYYWFRKVAEVGQDDVPSRLVFLPGGDPGALVNVAGAQVLASSDQAEQAEALADYLLSTEGQTYFAEQTLEYPLVEGVEPAADLPPLDSIESPDIDLSTLDSLDETLAQLEQSGLL